MKTPPIHPILNGGSFGLMSGEKPFFPAQIEATHENLVNTLKSMGLKHDQTHGRYGDPERSVIIHNPREDQMKTLGKLFGQESVIHSTKGQHKLIYTNGPDENKFRTTVPGQTPHEWFENPPPDYYTHIPGAGHFRINFDFDQDPQGANNNIKPGLAKSIFQRLKLKKALPHGANLPPKGVAPNPSPENDANRKAFPGSTEHAVMTDALSTKTQGPVSPRARRFPSIPSGKQAPPVHAATWMAVNETKFANANDDADRGWARDPEEDPYDDGFAPDVHIDDVQQKPVSSDWKLKGQLGNNQEADHQFWSHPNFYEWHDGHTDHHNPRPWDKKTAMDTARGLGLIKADVLNNQNAASGVSTYAKFAAPYGQIIPGTRSNLAHYDYNNKLPAVQDLVRKHGFQVYYAGGKYGKPDLANKNYNTNHLMIYDPGSHNDAQQGEVDYTNAWRQIHELAHAITYPELNKTYGEGRRIGKLGTHRTLNEAQRAVHWEHLAAHKQRELSKQIGVHVPDDVFNKEYNTVMHDAVHRAVTGQFTEPASEGFTPHAHQVPLSHALDMVRHEGKKMGLQHQHDLAPKRQ